MINIDICFVSGLHGEPLVPALSQKLLKSDKSLLVLSENISDVLHWRGLGITAFSIQELANDYNDDYKSTYSIIDSLISGRFSDASLFETERSYYKTPKFFLRSKKETIISALAVFFTKYKIGSFLHRPGGEILRLILKNTSAGFGSNSYIFGESYLNGYSVLYRDEFKTFVGAKVKQSPTFVSNMLSDKLTGKTEIRYGTEVLADKPSRLKALFTLIKYCNFNVIWSYFAIQYTTVFIGRVRRFFTSFMYSEFDNKRAFFYPLNVQAESELYVRNSILSEQYYVLKQLSKLCPANSCIYIKEHPGFSKSLSLLELLSLRLRGVKVLSPTLKMNEIFNNVKGVFCVSSTVAIESIANKKPVLVLGNWSYLNGNLSKDRQISNKKIISFFQTPQVDVTDLELSEELTNYIVKGDVYSTKENFECLINSIIELNE